jgi:succinate dehydrogenase / fumarate reductase cytochrome b subunit
MANYIIFNKMNKKLITKPFRNASEAFLKEFYIAKYAIDTKVSDIGSEKYILNPKLFAKRFVVVLAQAGKNGETIIAYDTSSYLSLTLAKSFIINNADVREEMEQILNPLELTTDFLADTLHINAFIAGKDAAQRIKSRLKHPFNNFKAAFYYGASIRADEHSNRELDKFFDTVELKRVRFGREFNPSGYELLQYAPQIAFKMAGAILLDAFDSGADFLIVNDTRIFYLMDRKRKEIECAMGREIPIYLLTLPQVALMAIGITNKKTLGFNAHKIKPTLLG